MSYQNVQFVALVIDTQAISGVDDAQSKYLGMENSVDDIRARCELFMRALRTASANLAETSPPEASGTTLRVFMVPEFFFRGSTGAYDMDTVQLAIEQLQQMVAKDEWTDWLFAFGKIVGMSTADTPSLQPGSMPAPIDTYNFTLLLQGGTDPSQNMDATLLMKELMSDRNLIGEVNCANGILLGDVSYLDPNSSTPENERQIVNYAGAGIFSLGGITWGINIYLNKNSGRLQQALQLPGANTVQVQLVPSCRVSVSQVQIFAGQQGFFFCCDDSIFGSNLVQVEPDGVALTPISMLGSFPVSGDPLDSDDSPPTQVAIGNLYPSGAGVIDIYPIQAVPPVSTVAGTTVPLNWQITDDYLLIFNLIYDEQGIYQACVCQVNSDNADIKDLSYILPLILQTSDSPERQVHIDASVRGGSFGYEFSIWCKLNFPGLIFEGVAAQFFNDRKNGSPVTCWQTI